jgi:hypothetical protein
MRKTLIVITLVILTTGFLMAAFFTLQTDPDDQPNLQSITLLSASAQSEALRLTVNESGIVGISAEKLRAFQLPVDSFSVDELKLSRDGQPVPFHIVSDNEDASLYFYAEALTSTIDAPAVYWLTLGQGVAMVTQDALPTDQDASIATKKLHWEENESFLAQANGSDVWLGPRIFAPAQYSLPLLGISSTGNTGKLTVQLWSNNAAPPDPDHHLRVLLNNKALADHYWDGIKQETIIIDIPAGILKTNENVIVFDAPGDTGAAGEAIYLDWIELEYESNLALDDGQLIFTNTLEDGLNDTTTVTDAGPNTLVFDISDPTTPVALTNVLINNNGVSFLNTGLGSKYVVLDQKAVIQPLLTAVPRRQQLLYSADNEADYVAIVADEDGFEEALQPLIDHRQAQGFKTKVVPVQQIYDEFAFGRQTPDAIRDFLRYAVENWRTSPRFALLVGDASYDTYNFENGRNRNLLPSFLVYTEYAGYVASDTFFSIFDEDTMAPQLAIGRFPVQTVRQLQTLVDKTLSYEAAGPKAWQNRALLVADDEIHFNERSDILAGVLNNTGYNIQKLYMTENEDIRDAIMSAINYGVGIINYVGHGSVRVWGDERVFQASDAAILENEERLPIFTTFTCLNGYFNHPQDDALAETLLWAKNGGVVAAIAPSGRSLPSQQAPLADTFYDNLLNAKVDTLGEALQVAKVDGSDDPYLAEVIHTFNLLGDPALKFKLPANSDE